jgi:tRNA G18 (ribose-2'-O)-methylase SpoU
VTSKLRNTNAGKLSAAELALFAGLRDRDLRAEGVVVAEGRLLAERLLAAARRSAQGGRDGKAGSMPGPLFVPPTSFETLGLLCVPALAEEFAGLAEGLCPLEVRPEPELAALAGFPFHRGVLAAARRGPLPRLADLGPCLPDRDPRRAGPSRVVVLPATADPENMGAVFRSAAALGWDAVLLGPACCDHLSRRALRASMGAALSLPAAAIDGAGALEALHAASYGLAAAVLDDGARPLAGWTAPGRLALLIGNEYEGLGPDWLGGCVERLTIPMAGGTDSLNAAAAAAIFLYCCR